MTAMTGRGVRPTEDRATAVLRLLATTDLHAAIRDYDYGSRRPDPSRGLSLAASLARQLGDAADCAVLLDNGDFLHGESNGAIAGSGVAGIMAAMNAAGFDAAALGNHEFDAGVGLLDQAMGLARFPVLCANVVRADGTAYAASHAVIERRARGPDGRLHPLRIGVVAVLPGAAIGPAGRVNLESLQVTDAAEICARLVPEMRRGGCDIVVGLCHAGLDGGGDATARALARGGLFDALVLGHSHGIFPAPGARREPGVDPVAGTVDGVPTVMPGVYGRYVGRIDLHLERSGGRWRTVRKAVALHAVSRRGEAGRVEPMVPCDPAVLGASRGLHREALAAGGRVAGRIGVPLATHFARVGRCRATRFVAMAKGRAVERALGRAGNIPIVGLSAPKWCGGRGGPLHFVDIAAGPVLSADLHRLCPFSDRIVAVAASGAELKDWLERSVSAFATQAAGRFAPRLVDPRFPPMDFDLPDRVRFGVDAGRPPLFDPRGRRLRDGPGRVHDLRLDGRPLEAEAPLILAVTDFRMRGGGGFPLPGGPVLVETGLTAREAVVAALEEGLEPPGPRIFDFHALAHATALVETGPGAARHHDLVADLPLERLGWDAEGFRTYLVHFPGPLETAGAVA